MKKYKLLDGYLECPSDWIVLNPSEAESCKYAGVVECRNSTKYGIPTFVFFSNYRYGCDYDHSYYDHINEMCVKAWPKFQEIIDAQVIPIPDPNKKFPYIKNQKEYLESPIIGYFNIFEDGETDDPPYGVVIVRTPSEDTVM